MSDGIVVVTCPKLPEYQWLLSNAYIFLYTVKFGKNQQKQSGLVELKNTDRYIEYKDSWIINIPFLLIYFMRSLR